MKNLKKRNVQIEKLKSILIKKWGLVRYSENDNSYDPEMSFYNWADYDIYAREIWLYLARKKPAKKKFIEDLSRNLGLFRKAYATNRPGLKQRCNHVAKLLWNTITHFDFIPMNEGNIKVTEIELRQKFRTHCCAELSCTDNASRRYFFRSRIVYIREINTYVLTNLRRYVPYGESGEYVMDQRVYYEELDYCPFCGFKLKDLRLENQDKQRLINEAILRWRDCGMGLLNDGEEEEHRLSYYGINLYDSGKFISSKLTDKYTKFDGSFGVAVNGMLTSHNPFITVEKLFDLCESHELFSYFDCDIEGISNEQFPNYCREKFTNRKTFSEDEKWILVHFIREMLIAMYHNPSYFDELAGVQK